MASTRKTTAAAPTKAPARPSPAVAPTPGPIDEATHSTRFNGALLKKARFVAQHKNLPLGVYLSESARATIDRDYAATHREMEKLL